MYELHWQILLQPEYLRLLLRGLWLTLALAALSSLCSFLLGLALTIGRARGGFWASFATGFCLVARGIPGVFWLLLPFYCLPFLLPLSASHALNAWEYFPFCAALLGLSVNNSPYLADILSSVLHVSGRDALACARLAGFRGWRYWLCLVLPLACSTSLPALNARMVHNLKNTSLALFISVPELTWAAQEIESLSFAGLEVFTAATLIYMVLGLSLSALLFWVQRRLERCQQGEAVRACLSRRA